MISTEAENEVAANLTESYLTHAEDGRLVIKLIYVNSSLTWFIMICTDILAWRVNSYLIVRIHLIEYSSAQKPLLDLRNIIFWKLHGSQLSINIYEGPYYITHRFNSNTIDNACNI